MKCANEGCDKSVEGLNAVLLNADGDFACSVNCQREYEEKRDHFLNHIVHSETLTEQWLKGEID